MSHVKNILLVTNSISANELALVKEAVSHAKTQELHLMLSLVHVIPYLPTCYYSIPSMALLTEGYYEEATHALKWVGEELSISKEHQRVITGRMRPEITRLANKLRTHFILASSTSIQDLHHSFMSMRREKKITPIKNIDNLVSI